MDCWKEHLNYCLSRYHMMLECTFGLKACWQALSIFLKVDEDNLLQLLISACVLHNICESMGEVSHQAWAEEALHVDWARQVMHAQWEENKRE